MNRHLPLLALNGALFLTKVAQAEPLEEGPAWAASGSAAAYLLPQEDAYLQPSATFDWRSLHLEARYNYEELATGSTWAGYNFSGGGALKWELTPMFGVVIGGLNGVAPGYTGALRWKVLELSSEGEYVFDFSDSSEWFFYNWSEFAVSPFEWLQGGLVVQRTRAYSSERDVQRGFFVGVSNAAAALNVYLFNPDDAAPTWVVNFELSIEP
jgi:hypothetical protein